MFEKKVLRAEEVATRIGISLPCLYRWIRLGRFPRGFKFSANIVGWTVETVDTWVADAVKRANAEAEQQRKALASAWAPTDEDEKVASAVK